METKGTVYHPAPVLLSLGAALAGVNWFVQPERAAAWAAELVLVGGLAAVSVSVARRRSGDAIRRAIVFAGLMLAIALSLKLAAALGAAAPDDLVKRMTMVILGRLDCRHWQRASQDADAAVGAALRRRPRAGVSPVRRLDVGAERSGALSRVAGAASRDRPGGDAHSAAGLHAHDRLAGGPAAVVGLDDPPRGLGRSSDVRAADGTQDHLSRRPASVDAARARHGHRREFTTELGERARAGREASRSARVHRPRPAGGPGSAAHLLLLERVLPEGTECRPPGKGDGLSQRARHVGGHQRLARCRFTEESGSR